MRPVPDDPQPLRVMPKTIPATCYNRVRLALIRLGKPLRFGLPRHRGPGSHQRHQQANRRFHHAVSQSVAALLFPRV